MTALWILLAIVALFAVINRLRVGVDVGYEGQTVHLRARVGPKQITILPRPEKPEKKPKKKKEKKPPEKKPEAVTEEKPKAKPDRETILTLARLGLEAAGAFRRKLRIALFRLYWIAGAKDPYDTAMQSGYVRAALDGLFPLAARALRFRERDVRVGADFTAEKPQIEGRLILTIRIGQIVAIGIVFACKFLTFTLRRKRERRREQKKAQQQTQAPKPAATESPTEERKVSNGA